MKSNVMIRSEDMDALCVCAVRYCQGRQTYMPKLIQEIVLFYLDKLSDRAVETILLDCETQRQTGNYGDENIDKPAWVAFEKKIRTEAERRKKDE